MGPAAPPPGPLGIGMNVIEKLKNVRIPFADVLGIEFVSADSNGVVATMRVRDELCTNSGVVHGGALMAFADTD